MVPLLGLLLAGVEMQENKKVVLTFIHLRERKKKKSRFSIKAASGSHIFGQTTWSKLIRDVYLWDKNIKRQ